MTENLALVVVARSLLSVMVCSIWWGKSLIGALK